MKPKVVIVWIVALLVLLVGCGKKVDEDELYQANNLIQGLTMLGMMTDVDAYSSSYLCAPPLWEGPAAYNVPEEWADLYYRFVIKFPVDSQGVTIDSGHLYLMFTPDIWDSAHANDTIIKMDIGLLADNRNIWFRAVVGIPDTAHVTGDLKWNWNSTWYRYEFDNSTITEAALITITTSSDIRLSAQFKFGDDGAGTTEDNWAKFDQTIFVRYEFFAQPDPNGYDGYFILLSEGWKVKHYFKLARPAA
ncbi:MAG: hypothetical protein ABIL02_02705 [candidate division WOR-3 bacterium]